MNKRTFVLLILLLILLGLLGWRASRGDLLAVAMLTALGTVTLILIGAGISLLHARLAAKQQEAQFNANVRENMAIMQQMQALQNAQNQQLWQQVKHLPAETSAAPPAPTLLIDDGIFSELE